MQAWTQSRKTEIGKTDFDVILVHAGTNNIRTTTPDQLKDEVLDTLDNPKW